MGRSPPKGGFAFSGPRLRTIVYVDGFNLYYGSLKGTPYKWLDLCAYFRAALPADCTLEAVKYFTARVSPRPGDPDVALHQDAYLRALRAVCGASLQIIEGRFITKPKSLPLETPPPRFARVLVSEEKGSDVNLAVHLVNDAWADRFECAAVVSNDSDMENALRIAKYERGKHVLLYTPGYPVRRRAIQLKRWSNRRFAIDPTLLAASQLPDPVPGTNLTKPQGW